MIQFLSSVCGCVCVSVCGGGVGVGACACVCVCLRESTCVYVRAGLEWKLVPHYIFLGEVFHSSSLAIFVHERDGLSCWMLRKFQFSPRRVVPLPGRASLFEAETSVVTKTSCKNERLGKSIVQKSCWFWNPGAMRLGMIEVIYPGWHRWEVSPPGGNRMPGILAPLTFLECVRIVFKGGAIQLTIWSPAGSVLHVDEHTAACFT